VLCADDPFAGFYKQAARRGFARAHGVDEGSDFVDDGDDEAGGRDAEAGGVADDAERGGGGDDTSAQAGTKDDVDEEDQQAPERDAEERGEGDEGALNPPGIARKQTLSVPIVTYSIEDTAADVHCIQVEHTLWETTAVIQLAKLHEREPGEQRVYDTIKVTTPLMGPISLANMLAAIAAAHAAGVRREAIANALQYAEVRRQCCLRASFAARSLRCVPACLCAAVCATVGHCWSLLHLYGRPVAPTSDPGAVQSVPGRCQVLDVASACSHNSNPPRRAVCAGPLPDDR
jgi:hypothetical protein